MSARALGIGVALALASCGGSRVAPAAGVAPPQEWPVGDERARARITTLDREIADRAAALGLEPPAVVDPGGEPMADPAAPSTCERSPRPVCQDVCGLADAICTAATEICKLAGELPGDAWAAQRCAAGTGSCAQARDRCCGC